MYLITSINTESKLVCEEALDNNDEKMARTLIYKPTGLLYFCILWCSVELTNGQERALPSVYEYFGTGANLTGLLAANQNFTLNGKPLRIISGSVHYFRVHPKLWRDRLRKLRAIGANTVETYTAWNLHEPRKGEFDFGQGQNDFSEFLDLRSYLRIAQEEDLLVIIRPGPFICGEWEFGGFPSWLQRDPNMRVREYNKPYLTRVGIYYDKLLPLLADFQFTRGGSIIAAQIENEYSYFTPLYPEYLEFLKDTFDKHGLSESLYFTSDNSGGYVKGLKGTLPGMLKAANFNDPDETFPLARKAQPNMPLMAMEFWSGWFNHWGEQRSGLPAENFEISLEKIFQKYNASVNMYMFHGGTNFGFMGGGNVLQTPPYIAGDITSYDYDAPLSEAGDYTEKYEIAARLISQYSIPKLQSPPRPPQSRKMAYPPIPAQKYLTYKDILSRIPASSKFFMDRPVSMENLPMNNDSGQSFGYVIYRTYATLSPYYETMYKGSYPRDIGYLIVDGEIVSQQNDTDYWINSVREFQLTRNEEGVYPVDLMVESLARVNFGVAADFIQQKGITPVNKSNITINGVDLYGVEIIAAEFKNSWIKSLTNFRPVGQNFYSMLGKRGPLLLQFKFSINEEPADTFLNMSRWNKGIVFVNGFNIGRYWRIGPQQHLYVPAPFLRRGENTITVFEIVRPHSEMVFSDIPNLG